MRPVLLLSLLLATGPLMAAPQAGWRSGWGLAGRAAPAAAGERGPPGVARLRLEARGSQWQARVDTPLAGPVQIELRDGNGDGRVLARQVLPAGGSLEVRLSAPAEGAPAPAVQLQAVPGDPRARAQDWLYRLPFALRGDGGVRVDQPPGGRFSHDDDENRDAIDFALPEGTPVLAARAGRVMQVQDRFRGNGLDPLRDRERANFIRVLHDDGSMAVYAHLRADGVLVRHGQQVEAGQRIGLSGNTGYSAAPHLHFVVQLNRGLRLQSVPVRLAGPHGELRFAKGDGGD